MDGNNELVSKTGMKIRLINGDITAYQVGFHLGDTNDFHDYSIYLVFTLLEIEICYLRFLSTFIWVPFSYNFKALFFQTWPFEIKPLACTCMQAASGNYLR